MATISSPRSTIALISGARRSVATSGAALAVGAGPGDGCGGRVAASVVVQKAIAVIKAAAKNRRTDRPQGIIIERLGIKYLFYDL
jgi:hypothetical protein